MGTKKGIGKDLWEFNEDKRKVKRCIYLRTKKANEQFGRKMNQDGKLKYCSSTQNRTEKMPIGEDNERFEISILKISLMLILESRLRVNEWF